MNRHSEVRRHGYRHKRDLPAIPGSPKLCPKCDLFFVALPRERMCGGCRTPAQKARSAASMKARGTATLRRRVNDELSQVKRTQKTLSRVLTEASRALDVPGLEGYVVHMLMLAEDIRAKDPWSRQDQLVILGAIWVR